MILRLVCIILSLFSLSGCADGTCLDADDFGFARFTVSARYDSSDLQGQQDNQIAPWKNTGYTVNGTPLVVVVKNWNSHDNANTENQLSAWCPWYGGNSGATGLSSLLGNLGSVIPIGNVNSFKNGLSKICENLAVCEWVGDEMCTDTVDAQILNAPCLLTKGVGLYALITGPSSNPNSNNATMVNPASLSPSGIALHVGAKHEDYTLYDVDSNGKYAPAGGVIYHYTDPTHYNNGGLYFKILDKHYGDNSGQYLVTVKSGLNNDIPDPIQFITNMVAQYFFGSSAFLNNPGDSRNQTALTALFTGVTLNNTGVVQSIYQSLIQNSLYKNFVRGCLTIYVMLTGLYYLAGLLQVTTKELVARIVKITIVAALLDPDLGWSFFHDYLFVFFIEGVQQMIGIIQTAAATGPGPTSIISLMLAPQTITKLMSLLFTSGMGIVYIILYFLIFIFIVAITFRAAVLYLNCLIMIGMIIIMGPIFLCFMLFGWTKSLFENWLKQLISYALQPIILITALAFVSILVRHEIYATLGFPVCREAFLPSVFDTIDPSGKSSSIFSWWFPVPMDGNFSDDLVTIPVPEAHHVLDEGGNKTGEYCQAYACNEPRYVQLPFLDPNSPSDMKRKNTFFEGSYTQILGLIYIIILCYLLNKFNESAVSIARALTETAGSNATDMDKASQTPGFTDMLKGIGKGVYLAGQSMSNRAGINATASPEEQTQKARGGLKGSKDDGSGTKSESNLKPRAPQIDPAGTKPWDKSVTDKVMKGGIQGGKKGSVDDIGIRNSTTKEGPKQQKTLAELKAEWKKPVLAADIVTQEVGVENIVEKQRPTFAPAIEKKEVSAALERKAPPTLQSPSKVSEKASVENIVEKQRPVSAPARVEKASVTLERKASPPVKGAGVIKQEVSVSEVALESKAPPTSQVPSKVSEKASVENAPPIPKPSAAPLPLPPKRTTTENRENYAKDPETQAKVARAQEMRAESLAKKAASAPSTPRAATPPMTKSASAPNSPRVATPSMQKSASAPSTPRSSYMDHTKSSATRSEGNIENRKTQEGLKAKDQAKRPQSPALTKSASAPSSPRVAKPSMQKSASAPSSPRAAKPSTSKSASAPSSPVHPKKNK